MLCTYIDDGDEIGGISSTDDVIEARADWPAYLARREAEFEAEANPGDYQAVVG
ncbi:hypothetical protein ACFQ1S_05150 [Kibdelosporangium lantanae]|uniref:Uncharacterized protein n=1 Tax=Kibdelosporangium lantanae TaxID=1497396 RepID=A0ABW3M312_9PSEU